LLLMPKCPLLVDERLVLLRVVFFVLVAVTPRSP
jgi:hypothetical protein